MLDGATSGSERMVMCVDDDWVDILSVGDDGNYPKAGRTYTISAEYVIGGAKFLRFSDPDIADDYYGASAFIDTSCAEGRPSFSSVIGEGGSLLTNASSA